jgi:hypothetical protein
MAQQQAGPGDREVRKALEVLERKLFYVVQRKRHGQILWETHERIRGKKPAYDAKAILEREDPTSEWRVVQLNEAQRVAEGVELGRRVAKKHFVRRRSRPLSLYLPDNL